MVPPPQPTHAKQFRVGTNYKVPVYIEEHSNSTILRTNRPLRYRRVFYEQLNGVQKRFLRGGTEIGRDHLNDKVGLLGCGMRQAVLAVTIITVSVDF